MATVGKTSLRTAIVFGANGVSGTAAITQMLKGDAFDKIIAVSRRPGQIETDNPRVIWVTLDVLASNAADLAKALVDFGGEEATHAFHFAYIEKESPEEQTKVNVELLRKALDATNNACPDLKTFLLQTGMKYYACHQGPPAMSPFPFREDQPRPDKGPNFYYPQEDMVQDYAKKRRCRWIITRPNIIVGVSKGNYMNMAVSLGIYAALQKELGRDFLYPGNAASWSARVDHSTATNNADFQIWASLNPNAWNQAFNITNGDNVRICDLWHKIADYFGLKVPENQGLVGKGRLRLARTFSLGEYMQENKETWHQMVKKYNLDPKAFDFATWAFVDFIFARTWGDEASIEKARSFGWTKTVDTTQGYYDAFDKMKELRMIPS